MTAVTTTAASSHESPATTLRRAAQLMRKEASAPHTIAVIKRRTICGARVHHGPDGPHHRDPAHPKWCNAQPAGATQPAPSDYERTKVVALAVADWLEGVASRIEEIHASLPFSARLTLGSLNVTAATEALVTARAYLGELSA